MSCPAAIRQPQHGKIYKQCVEKMETEKSEDEIYNKFYEKRKRESD
jgi:hypothetical protein